MRSESLVKWPPNRRARMRLYISNSTISPIFYARMLLITTPTHSIRASSIQLVWVEQVPLLTVFVTVHVFVMTLAECEEQVACAVNDWVFVTVQVSVTLLAEGQVLVAVALTVMVWAGWEGPLTVTVRGGWEAPLTVTVRAG